MIATLITFGVLLAVYGAVMWLTREGGPCDAMRFWDEGQGQ